MAEERTAEGSTPDLRNASNENIFLFWPNIVGYVRVVLVFASLYFMPLHPRRCTFLYSISCLLDALDGYLARRFEQSTRFGAVLDMVTDRCTTACLLVFLASAWPRFAIIFQGLISLDLASHYVHMYATLVAGAESHKNIGADDNYILHLYYTNKTGLFLVCCLNEVFFIALYLVSFSFDPFDATPDKFKPSYKILFEPWSAGALELARAKKIDLFVPYYVALVCLPVMALKQYLNILQLVRASKMLAEGDREMRKAAGLPRKKKAQ